jgi:NAD(P)-dependent dehydrogenase (short-subunit alcohol dehydrogenase family)
MDEFTKVVHTNLGGQFLFCKHVIPYMQKQRGGVIVNMSSVSAHVGQVYHTIYGATKGAISAMTRAMAWELAPDNIRVNTISPGSVDTPMLRADVATESKRRNVESELIVKERAAHEAFKRWATPSEVATVIAFLASEESSFINGADILADGGWTAQ